MCEASACDSALPWWPVELDEAELEAVSAFYDELEAEPCALDETAARRADAMIAAAMQRHLGEIMDGAVLSHYCHLLNGWGDAMWRGHRLAEGLASFCRGDADGHPYLVQYDRDGDFHPGQTLAYAVMAGVDPDAPVAGLGCSLRALYEHSRTLQTDEGAELGHLLFALAHLGVDVGTRFAVPGGDTDVAGLMERAIEGHHHGHFRVCRKVHLTEGICAAAAMIPGLESHRAQAQAFLDGQLDLMLLLALALERGRDPEHAAERVAPGGIVHALRQTLAVADHFEDHVFLAGHYIELAVFAGGMGYEISPHHRDAMVRIANAIDQAIPTWLPRSPFAEQFLFYGHYRRALTLLPGFLRAYPQPWAPSPAERAAFTVDFDALAADEVARTLAPLETPARAWSGAFTTAPAKTMRPEFAAVVDAFAALAPAELAPRGFRSHFRHIRPAAWPFALHYELLDYDGHAQAFTLEIHLESDAVRPLRETLAALLEPVRARFPERYVDWEPHWGRERGRLRVAMHEETPPAVVAAAMMKLIEHTREPISRALAELCATECDPGLGGPAAFAVA